MMSSNYSVFFTELLRDATFIVSLVATIIASLLLLYNGRSHKRLKTLRACAIITLVISCPVLGGSLLSWSFTTVQVNASPTGEYMLITRWVDQGGFGYFSTEVIIAKPGLFGERHGIGFFTPLSTKWLSDETFLVRSGTYRNDEKVLKVSEFFQ